MELTQIISLVISLCPPANHKGAVELAPFIQMYSHEYEVPAEIAVAVMVHESGCRLHKIGSKGEIGPFQILPKGSAAVGYKISSLKIHSVNVRLGIKHLAKCARRCKGRFDLGLSIYNGHRSCIESDYSKAIMKLCQF